jgi:hypothetical protein
MFINNFNTYSKINRHSKYCEFPAIYYNINKDFTNPPSTQIEKKSLEEISHIINSDSSKEKDLEKLILLFYANITHSDKTSINEDIISEIMQDEIITPKEITEYIAITKDHIFAKLNTLQNKNKNIYEENQTNKIKNFLKEDILKDNYQKYESLIINITHTNQIPTFLVYKNLLNLKKREELPNHKISFDYVRQKITLLNKRFNLFKRSELISFYYFLSMNQEKKEIADKYHKKMLQIHKEEPNPPKDENKANESTEPNITNKLINKIHLLTKKPTYTNLDNVLYLYKNYHTLLRDKEEIQEIIEKSIYSSQTDFKQLADILEVKASNTSDSPTKKELTQIRPEFQKIEEIKQVIRLIFNPYLKAHAYCKIAEFIGKTTKDYITKNKYLEEAYKLDTTNKTILEKLLNNVSEEILDFNKAYKLSKIGLRTYPKTNYFSQTYIKSCKIIRKSNELNDFYNNTSKGYIQ